MAEITATFPLLDGAAGAAFLLKTPASRSMTLLHAMGEVRIREGAPYATVELISAPTETELRAEAWRVVQEALDIRAATHLEALATHRGDSEYLAWLRTEEGYRLIVSAIDNMAWSFHAQLSFDEEEVSATNPMPQMSHHPSFRFYRLAQLTDDLFDAFRNAYLALECLISAESPKQKQESEREWLKRVLSGPLASGLPGGMDVDATVEQLYCSGRLPLFHAKMGQFYMPHCDERERVQSLLITVNLMLTTLYRRKFQHCPGGWGQLSQATEDAATRAVLRCDEVILKNASSRSMPMSPKVQLVDEPRRRGQLWGKVLVEVPSGVAFIDCIELRNGGEDWIWMDFLEALPMQGISEITIELCVLHTNTRAPKPLHGF